MIYPAALNLEIYQVRTYETKDTNSLKASPRRDAQLLLLLSICQKYEPAFEEKKEHEPKTKVKGCTYSRCSLFNATINFSETELVVEYYLASTAT